MRGFPGFRDIKAFFTSRPHSALLLAWPLEIIWYGVLNHAQSEKTSHVIQMALDGAIPFCEYFIVPYVLWYPYLAFAAFYTLWKSKRDFIHTTVMMYLGMFGSMIFATLYPTWHNLRPALSSMNDNIFSSMVKALWKIDNPAVIFPSMHVLVAILVTIALFKAECMAGKVWWKTGFAVYCVLVSLSTVYTKQHSAADVFFALAFVLPYYLLTYYVIYPKRRRETP